MKNVLCLIIFSFASLAYVMGNQHLNRRWLFSKPTCPEGELKLTLGELENLMAPKKSILLTPVSVDCLGNDMKAKCKPRPDIESGIHCNFEETTCFAVTEKWKSSQIVQVISKTNDVIPPGFDLCKNILTLQAVALPFFPNEDSYTILNPRVAPWFFTDNLGGCDVFVVTTAYRQSSPMVIHSNRNKFIKDLARDLQTKGEDVDVMLNRISKSDGYEWKVIASVYHGPTTELGKEKIGLNRYADEHPGIKLIGYHVSNYGLTEHFSFFGQYIEPNILAKAKGYRARWKFIFKVHSTGTILGEIVVSANGELI